MTKIIPIDPVPKPRMTQRDKWAKRPSVLRYRDFCDKLRQHNAILNASGSEIIFVIPMPKSWSEKKKAEMAHKPHQQRPDIDNLVKAVLDALHDEDCHIWSITATKIWGYCGEVIID